MGRQARRGELLGGRRDHGGRTSKLGDGGCDSHTFAKGGDVELFEEVGVEFK